MIGLFDWQARDCRLAIGPFCNYKFDAFNSRHLHESEIQVQFNQRFFFLAASRLVLAASRLSHRKKKKKNLWDQGKGPYCIKTSPYFSKNYNFKYHKNTLYGLNIQPSVRISKNISGQMVLSRPPWSVSLANFARNPPLEGRKKIA